MKRSEIIVANRQLRSQDESHLYPIRGRFNATERAIRRLRYQQRMGFVIDDINSYIAAVEQEISKIVNSF